MHPFLIIFLLFSPTAIARVSLLPPRESNPTTPVSETKAAVPDTKVKVPTKGRTPVLPSSSNLPPEYSSRTAESGFSENPILVPNQKPDLILADLKVGEVIEAHILESAIAFHDAKAPIRAVIQKGQLKGSVLIGEATYFVGEVVAAGAAGFADSTVERSQNALGNYVETPSLANSSKRALASALAKTAERFGEKMKTVPEYSVLHGPIRIRIIITDEIKTN